MSALLLRGIMGRRTGGGGIASWMASQQQQPASEALPPGIMLSAQALGLRTRPRLSPDDREANRNASGDIMPKSAINRGPRRKSVALMGGYGPTP